MAARRLLRPIAVTMLVGTQRPTASRRLPVGAEPRRDGLVAVRVWAPDHSRVAIVMDGVESALREEEGGYFSALVTGRVGSRYGFGLDGVDRLLPDPGSRFQPDGPHGLSEVVDPDAFSWTDATWEGLAPRGQVLYELHVGTFTPEGTWRAAAAELAALKTLGITAVQVMPVAEFPGSFGWGYDGVNWFAPTRLYGRPDDFRAFVDAAHGLGLGVLLDVVYNHLGPDGNYLGHFARAYFTDAYENEWGQALNFDGPASAGLRELVLSNAEYWMREFHLDGLRFDATQQIFDASPEHILAALTARVRAAAAPRTVLLTGENEPQRTRLMRPRSEGGCGLDLLYNDDWHHTARVALTGVREAYYSNYHGTAQQLVSATRWGFLYQGQRYPWQKKPRGTPALDVAPSRFLIFLENHDQIANAARGERLSTLAAPGRLRALTALLLCAPGTPLIFQGQEFGSTQPFTYFADHAAPLADDVRRGRHQFLEQFTRYAQPDVVAGIDPARRDTFAACVLDRTDTLRSRQWRALHEDLLQLRRTDPVLAEQRRPEGAVLARDALLLRWLTPEGEDRLLLVNLGPDLDVAGKAEPLMAPPEGRAWTLAWSSESTRYGGGGAPPPTADRWLLPGQAAAFAIAVPASDALRQESLSS